MLESPSEKSAKKSLGISWKEGIPASVMLGIMDYYLVPLGLFLGGKTPEIGTLVSLPHLLASTAQLFAVKVVHFAGSRLRFLVRATAVQATLLIPLAFLAILSFPGKIVLLIALATAFRILGNLIATAWGSLMSDYLAPHERGRYLGWRSQIVGIAGLAGICVGGMFLFFMKKISPPLGFFLLFLAASCCRFLSSYLMRRMAELPLQSAPGSDFTFLMFLSRFKESNFVKFVLYAAAIAFGTHMASPYFSVFMLKDLGLNYLNYMTIHLAAVVAGLLSFPIWGRHADRVGNARILKTTSLLIPLIPLFWVVSGGKVFALVLVELFAGFVWGGFNLCATNFIYDAVSPEKRVRCLGYFNLINGCAIFGGASFGGYLADRLPALWGYKLYALFLLSGAVRFSAHFLLSKQFKEVRDSAESVSSLDLFFSVIGMRSILGRDHESDALPHAK